MTKRPPEHLGQASFDITIVPSRAAYLVPRRGREEVRRAIQEATTRWAGVTEPIISVSAKGGVNAWHRQVVETARVDAVVNVGVHLAAAQAAADRLRLPLVDIAHIDKIGPAAWSAHPANLADTIFNRDHGAVARPDGPLWEAAAVGALTTAAAQDLVGAGVSVYAGQTPDVLARAALDRRTLIERTDVQFGTTLTINAFPAVPAIVHVTKPDSVNDIVWFWNVRALRKIGDGPPFELLLPDVDFGAWLGFADQLAAALARPDVIEPDVVITSLSAPPERLIEVGEALGLRPSTEPTRSQHRWPPPPLRTAPHTFQHDIDPRNYIVFDRTYGKRERVVTQLYRDDTHLIFDSPVQATGPGRSWLRISSDAFARFPRRPRVAALVSENASWRGDQLELATDLVHTYRLTMRIPSDAAVLAAVLEDVVPISTLSDKGRLGAAVLQQLDGSIEFLLDRGVAEAVTALTTKRSRQMLRELRRARASGDIENATIVEAILAWGSRVSRFYGPPTLLAEPAAGKDRARPFETLVAHGWAERGLAVECGRCRISSFVELRQVGEDGRCPACGAPAEFKVAGAQLAVQYRLNSFVDLVSDQGVLPHLLALAALQRTEPQTHLRLGTDVTFADGTAAEIDLLGIVGGRVVAGEVKTAATEHTAEQIRADVAHAAALTADVYILATTSNTTAAQRRTARSAAHRSGLDALILDGSQLRPGPDGAD